MAELGGGRGLVDVGYVYDEFVGYVVWVFGRVGYV